MPDKQTKNKQDTFVESIRQAAPYIQAHRGSTFVLMFSGEALDERFEQLVQDIALLHTFGIRLVLVHGARPQIEQRLKLRKANMQYVNGLRVTDDEALACVKDAVGSLRVEIEAQLSMSLVNTPTAHAVWPVAILSLPGHWVYVMAWITAIPVKSGAWMPPAYTSSWKQVVSYCCHHWATHQPEKSST